MKGSAASSSKADRRILKRSYEFIRDEEKDARSSSDWKTRMAVSYDKQLYKDVALVDLSRYESGQVGLRWRSISEVRAGKGKTECGNVKCDTTASSSSSLHSYEMLFKYQERSETKSCLVKVTVCKECAVKLFYKKLLKILIKSSSKISSNRQQLLESVAATPNLQELISEIQNSDSALQKLLKKKKVKLSK